MRFAVFTVSLPDYTPQQAVINLRELGYDGVEWRVTDQAATSDDAPGFWAGNRCTWPLSSLIDDAPRIRALTERAGLEMPNVGTYLSCENLAAIEQAMRGVVLLGAKQMRVNVPAYDSGTSYLDCFERARSQYREVEALAQQYGVRALVEIHHGSLTPSASAAARFLRDLDPQSVGAIYDPGNMVFEGYESYRLGLEVLGPYLAHVHLKNAQWQTVGTRADGSVEWQATWAAMDSGIVSVRDLFRALRAVGYDGWLAFEDFTTELPLRERLRANLAYVKRVLEQTTD